jgi:uncharacterized protein with HEPN domain
MWSLREPCPRTCARPLRSRSLVSQSRDELYLQHVLDAIEKIERYVAVGYDEFMAASHWQDAVIRQFEIIGEAVKRLFSDIFVGSQRPRMREPQPQ